MTTIADLIARANADNTIGKSFVERHTPGPDYTCKADKCDGKIESRLRGVGPCGSFFDTPKCRICGRQYLLAKNAPQVGFVEFEIAMSQTYSL